VFQVEIVNNTPKAFANFSPWLEHSDNHGFGPFILQLTLKGFDARETLSGFNAFLVIRTQGSHYVRTLG